MTSGRLSPRSLTLMDEAAPQRRYELREVFNALRWIVRAGAPRIRPNEAVGFLYHAGSGKVLLNLRSADKQVHAGKPMVKGAKVMAEVVRHGKGVKIKIYRFARRTGYRRHAGHRQPFTEVKIADVKLKD